MSECARKTGTDNCVCRRQQGDIRSASGRRASRYQSAE